MLNKYVGLSEEPVLIHYFTNTQCCNPTDTNQLCKKDILHSANLSHNCTQNHVDKKQSVLQTMSSYHFRNRDLLCHERHCWSGVVKFHPAINAHHSGMTSSGEDMCHCAVNTVTVCLHGLSSTSYHQAYMPLAVQYLLIWWLMNVSAANFQDTVLNIGRRLCTWSLTMMLSTIHISDTHVSVSTALTAVT